MVSCAHATVHVDDGSADKVTLGNRVHHLGDVFHFTDAVQQVQSCALIGSLTVHGSADHARCDRVDPDVLFAKFGSQLQGKGMDRSLGGNRCRGGGATQCVVYKRRADIDHHTAMLF